MLYWVAIATIYFRVCIVNMDHSTTYSNIDIILVFLTLPSTYNETLSLVFPYITNIIGFRFFKCRALSSQPSF